jgi:hypothetical protein
MRAALVILMMAGGPISALPASGSDPDPAARPGCQSPSGWGCSVDDVRAASESTLRLAGSTITASCDPRWEETPVDAVYMQACVESMRRLAAFLSEKWSAVLRPVDAGLIRYDWNKDFGCIDLVLGNGRGAGSCPVYGEARIPLTWREAEPAVSGIE